MTGAPAPLAADPGPLADADFAIVARIAHAHAGIVLHAGKRVLVASRLARLVRAHRCADLHELVQLLRTDAAARAAAVEALTTNHTKFFREDHHFAHVAATLRPALTATLRAGGRVRLWSAGSSSGEEVYSLALTLLGGDASEGRQLLNADLALLATDLNARVIAQGRAGCYPAEAAAAIPLALARAWTEPHDEGIAIRTDVRRLVRFRGLNLLHEWPFAGQFDAIFCRNTMIYFDAATNERLQCRLADRLLPGGYLYIGHSERLLGEAAARLRPVGQTIFRKVPA